MGSSGPHALEHRDSADGGIGIDLDDAFRPRPSSTPQGLHHVPGFDFQVYSLALLQVADYSKQVSRLWISLGPEHAHEAFTRFPESFRRVPRFDSDQPVALSRIFILVLYGFIDGFVRLMRSILPNAPFVSFTGMPIDL